MAAKGTHRIKNTPPLEDGVWIADDDGEGFEIPKSEYVKYEYEPPVDTLPWDEPEPKGSNVPQS
jgi:hypothetical protein